MKRYFNITGPCLPCEHYMVDLQSRLAVMKRMIDRGQYFTINRARQFGKTTILKALYQYLKKDYYVISLDFQALSHTDFENEQTFVSSFSELLIHELEFDEIPNEVESKLKLFTENGNGANLRILFHDLKVWCAKSGKPIVLLIDEVDSASNYQVFLDFLAQLRADYINREKAKTFQSVILASVYDIKNIQQKIRSDSEHKRNSPWNIAAPFPMDFSFHSDEIAGMLKEYENDYATGMNIKEMAQLLYDYTSGYPFLVSRLCQIIDENIIENKQYCDKSQVWTKNGFLEAVKLLLIEKNTLFDSLINKLSDYKELNDMLYALLFSGKSISYSPDVEAVSIAAMFGFIKNKDGMVQIYNRIFETRLYNMFLTSSEIQNIEIYNAALADKNEFVENGHLDMDLILERFVIHFHDLYGDCSETFIEEEGRRYFLLYLRPIINGIGTYYVEAQTRDNKRTDIIVDYKGEQFVIELKIWHGNTYNQRGEEQLFDYLNFYHLKKGYMLSFNFNKKKKIGVKKIKKGEFVLIEAVV